eukprot:727088-Amphidinium_carterae.1
MPFEMGCTKIKCVETVEPGVFSWKEPLVVMSTVGATISGGCTVQSVEYKFLHSRACRQMLIPERITHCQLRLAAYPLVDLNSKESKPKNVVQRSLLP